MSLTSTLRNSTILTSIIGLSLWISASGVLAADKEEKQESTIYVFDLGFSHKIKYEVQSGNTIEANLINFIPGYTYSINIELKDFSVPKIKEVPTLKDIPEVSALGFQEIEPSDPCLSELTAYLNSVNEHLKNARNETEVGDFFLKSEKNINTFSPSDEVCLTPEKKSVLEAAIRYYIDSLREFTSMTLNSIPVMKEGNQLNIKVTRKDPNGKSKPVEWEFSLVAPLPEFETLYGFTFINQGLSRNREYFSLQIDSASFRIDSSSNANWGDFDLSPTVFVAWFPSRGAADINCGILGGIGIENDAVTVAFGGFASFNRNLG
ncbi:MAG TPA: hypothetical protein VHP63_06075, partial [candidate division Zixibacteria bacterium]|nr:hypothetical protein [candidate division Zixibacteria bacterium]